jgi:tetratricopeptide (TPR) repeat protein
MPVVDEKRRATAGCGSAASDRARTTSRSPGRARTDSLACKWLPCAVMGFALLAVAPRGLAVVANNVASRILALEWSEADPATVPPGCATWLLDSAADRWAQYALNWSPHFQRALVSSGRAYWLEGNCLEAEEAWRQALEYDWRDVLTAFWLFQASVDRPEVLPGELSAEAMAAYAFGAGRRAEDAAMSDVAEEWYELSLWLSPSRQAASRVSLLYISQGSLPDAIRAWRQVADSLPPDDSDHWWAEGQAAELAEEWEKAADAYVEACKLSEEPYESHIRHGVVLDKLKRWEEATLAYSQALTARPDLPWPYLSLGHVSRDREEYEAALCWYSQAETVASGHLAPVYYQGLAYYLIEDLPAARIYLERTLQASPNHVGGNYYLGQVLYRAGETDKAEVYLARAVDLHEGQPWRWVVQLGDWRLQLGDKDGALAAYEQALLWQPEDHLVLQRIQDCSVPE